MALSEESRVDEFSIPNPHGSGGLLFYDRSPYDPTEPLNNYWVRITDHNFSVACKVWACHAPSSHPAKLFADMALQWSGWHGEMAWQTYEEELALSCRHDKFGHIAIRVKLLSGWKEDAWRVEATTMAEAGQLDAIALRAAAFFGREAIG